MLGGGWIQEGEAQEIRSKATEMKERQQKAGEHIVVDIGEGWGSVRRALQALPGVTVVGVDRRGHTNTGAKHGVITAAVNHDLASKGKEDILTTLARKVGARPRRWTLVWMSLECSSMSIANAINQATGSAHGKWANTEQNKRNTTEERIQQEVEYLRETNEVLENITEALQQHPELKFALENPATSQTWKAEPLVEAIRQNPHWRMVRVDQCAYGRKSQKPTHILTNLKDWEPAGRTGNGRCKIGECGGTEGNKKGNRAHKEQTVPNSREKRPSQGQRSGGRWDYVKEAITNAVAGELTTEITRAAIRETEEGRKRGNLTGVKQRAPPVGPKAEAGGNHP